MSNNVFGGAMATPPNGAGFNFLQAGSGATLRTVQDKLRDMVSVKDFGAVGDGVTDDTVAITAAHATGRPIFYPYGTYKFVGYFPECEGGIIGEGWTDQANGKTTAIVFYNQTDTARAAIKIKEALPISRFFRIENIQILASSWDATTGCLGYGMFIGQPVRMTNVQIRGFKKSNIFAYATLAGAAPYESVLTDVVSVFSGQHGFLCGTGANVITLINYQGKWNGAPSFLVAPSVAGSYDGFHIALDNQGLSGLQSYTPESLTIISGDCSYNSRYGWNFSQMRNSSSVFPGYAEGNLTKNVRIGNVKQCHINIPQVENGMAGIQNDQSYGPYFYTNKFYYGGKCFHPANNYDLVQNPTLDDLTAGDVVQNAPTRNMYLSRSDAGGQLVYFAANTTPDGTAVNKATEAVLTLLGFSTYSIGIGSGSRHLKIGLNTVRLPDLYQQATTSGWGASTVNRDVGTAAPVSGTWAQGDIRFNLTPTAGGFIGWVCTAGGTPGTWKTFGAISP